MPTTMFTALKCQSCKRPPSSFRFSESDCCSCKHRRVVHVSTNQCPCSFARRPGCSQDEKGPCHARSFEGWGGNASKSFCFYRFLFLAKVSYPGGVAPALHVSLSAASCIRQGAESLPPHPLQPVQLTSRTNVKHRCSPDSQVDWCRFWHIRSYIYMHTHTYIHTYIHTYTYIHACIHTCIK